MEKQSVIKKRRLELGLTMKEVAKAVGVSEATVSKWESGTIDNMKRDKIAKLAKALNMSPLAVAGIEEQAPLTEKEVLVNKAMALLEGLTPAQLEQVVQYAAFLKSQSK